MAMIALMFFNCCQSACDRHFGIQETSKATPIMIRWKHWYLYQVMREPVTRLSRLTIRNGISKSFKGSRPSPVCLWVALEAWSRGSLHQKFYIRVPILLVVSHYTLKADNLHSTLPEHDFITFVCDGVYVARNFCATFIFVESYGYVCRHCRGP